MDFIVCGLGNIGTQYDYTRHNVGFLLVDYLVQHTVWKQDTKFFAETAIVSDKEQKVIYIKPTTFMNESGRAVRAISDYYQVPHDHIIVIHDDVDLPLGTVRIAYNRGDGGHNGIRSIYAHTGTKEIIRVRIGVAVLHDGMSIKPNVLGRFSSDELELVQKTASKVRDIIETITHEGKEKAMNKFN